MDDCRRELFATIDACPWLDFLLLTKRPGNIQRMWPSAVAVRGTCPQCKQAEGVHGGCGCGLLSARWLPEHRVRRPNVHIIYSASDQPSLEAGIGDLLKCRDLVPVLGLSLEPLIGPVDLVYGGISAVPSTDGFVGHPDGTGHKDDGAPHVDWVIVGGESGHGARPCNVEWIRSIVRQCAEAGVPCFVKQLGSRPYRCIGGHDSPAASYGRLVDCRGGAGYGCEVLNLRDSKGGDWDEWTEDLRVRQWPEQLTTR
jgi:protein gp37